MRLSGWVLMNRARDIGLLPGALHPLAVPGVDLFGPGLEFLLHLQRRLEGCRGHEFRHESADRPVRAAARHMLADRRPVPDAAPLAHIAGDQALPAGVTADRHRGAALAADRQPLQEGRPLPRRPPAAAAGCAVVLEALPAGFETLPGDVALMLAAQQDLNLFERHAADGDCAVGPAAAAGAAEDEGACIAGIVEDLQDPRMGQPDPDHLAFAAACAQSPGKQHPRLAESLHGRRRRSGAGEGVEQHGEALAHPDIGIKNHPVERVIDQAGRERQLEFAAPGPADDSTLQARPQDVQLRLRHLALHSQDEPVVEAARIIEAVLVEDQCACHRAEIEQPAPVAGIAGETADLETGHDPGFAQGDLAGQRLESFAVPVGAGLAEIRVDHDDLLDGPAERVGPVAQFILAAGALRVLRHLAQCRLADVEKRVPGEMAGCHFLVFAVHDAAPFSCSMAIAATMLTRPDSTSPGSSGAGLRPCSAARTGAGGAAPRTANHAAMPRWISTARPLRPATLSFLVRRRRS